MSAKLGCHVTYLGQKCLSVSTGTQSDGSYEILIHGLAGPGVQRHLHGWASVSSDGIVASAGSRLKNDIGDHVGPGVRLAAAGLEIGRVVLTPQAGGVVTLFRQAGVRGWLETAPSTHGGAVSRPEVPLPMARSDAPVEYAIEMFDARSGVPSDTSTQVAARLSAPLPFGVLFRAIAP